MITRIPNIGLSGRLALLSSGPFHRVIVVALLIGLMEIFASAQNIQYTQGSVGSGLEDTIHVPLYTYPGRGSTSLSVSLSYSSRVWRIGSLATINNNLFTRYQTITEAIYAEYSMAGWKSSLDLPIVEWPRNDDTYYYTGRPFCAVCGSNLRQFRVARVYIIMPNGTKYELRKRDQPYEGSIDMVGTFYAVDGSRLRYDSTGQSTGTLFLPDGTRYVLNGGTAQYIDHNGNTLNYNASTRQWTDTLGRAINVPLPANPTVGEQSYYLPGVPLPYKFIWKHLSDTGVLTPLSGGVIPTRKPIANEYLPLPNQPPTPPSGNNFPITIQSTYSELPSLFISAASSDDDTGPYTLVVGRGQVGSALFDPIVLTEIVLPNNLSYRFTYNIYGEIDKVVYPTGGFERYTYSTLPAIGDLKQPYVQANRGVTLRQLSANGTGNDLVDWLYESTGSRITVTPPLNGARTETYRSIFPTPEHQGTQGSLTYYWPFGFEDARQGQVYEERVYAPGEGGAMLRRTLREFDQTGNAVQPSIPALDPTMKSAYRNARLRKEVILMLDTGGDALAKTITHDYEPNEYELSTGLDRTITTETHFASIAQTTGQSGLITAMTAGPLASRAETTYLDNSAYQSRNILGLPTSVVLTDASLQIVSRTDYVYDETAYPLLTYTDLTGPDYIDPGTSARGNVTTSKRYVDIGTNLYLETHAQFDQCGNLRNAWDVRGIESQTQYSSTYKHAFVTQATTAIPDPSGNHGSSVAFTMTSTFDLTTGLPLTTTDANGQSTSFSYKDDLGTTDPLNRLRKVTRPDGGWTKYSFGEALGDLFVLTEMRQDATRTVKTFQYLDPLGRVTRSFVGEGTNGFLATDTMYDQLGRVWKVSNPYRTSALDGVPDLSHSSNWTASQYDVLGRVNLITLQDGSTVQSSYQGVYTTVTDQAGRQRRQKKDALGRIVRVDELNASGSLGSEDAPTQATYYEYNTQGDLIHIAQGANPVQHRYFKYDALGRLTYERQVEQAGTFTVSDPVSGNNAWSRKLVYDESVGGANYKGLLTSVYDARNIETQFRYDNLNRVYQVTYSDSTPTVTNKYDQTRTGYFNKGRLTEATTAAVGSLPATAQVYNSDLMGRVVNNQQSVGAETYTMSYSYNLGGALTSETYPSGRVVSHTYDEAARLSQVSSGTTVYASQFDYSSSSGLLKSFTMGNETVESYVYNSRLQIQSLDLTKSGVPLQHYDYKYGVYDPVSNTLDESKNNGNIAQIDSFIGTQKEWQQRFAHDSMGRLSTVREFRGDNNQQTYRVNYEYDVFGNRYQKQAQNSGNPFTQKWVEAGQIDQTSNRFSSGVTYDDAGNITVDSKFRNLQFQYDANNRQKQSANVDGTGAVVSVYDAGGQRVATQVAGSLTKMLVYDATGKLVAEYNSTTVSGGTQYVFSDHQGSPRTITSSGGVVISRHDYLAFGEELGTVGMRTSSQGYAAADAARLKYAGMEGDEATGMAHTLWRQYDSYSGRWTTPDPYGGSMTVADPQSFNRYVYVNNNPVNQIDPTGLMLSDIGVYQTEDPEGAKIAEDQSLRDLQQSVNEDYERRHRPPVPSTLLHDLGHSGGSQDADDSEESSEQNHASLGYGRIVASGRNRIEQKCDTWVVTEKDGVVVSQRLESTVTVGVSKDVTTASIVYSNKLVGESAQEDPWYGLFRGDVRGHIIGRALGGGGKSSNLFSQNPAMNNSLYKKVENGVRKTLTKHKDWTANLQIDLVYTAPTCKAGITPNPRDFRPVAVVYVVQYVDAQGRIASGSFDVIPNP